MAFKGQLPSLPDLLWEPKGHGGGLGGKGVAFGGPLTQPSASSTARRPDAQELTLDIWFCVMQQI